MQPRIQDEFSAISAAPEYTHRQHHTLKPAWQISHPFGCRNQRLKSILEDYHINLRLMDDVFEPNAVSSLTLIHSIFSN
jgi:hypothetical protein